MEKIFLKLLNIFLFSAYNVQKEKFFKELLKMKLEEKLMEMDFYKLSKVQESLLERINQRRARDNELMELEELDYVSAAGTPNTPNTKQYPPKIK